MKKMFILAIAFSFVTLINLQAQTAPLFKDGDTVCFLGDSITHGGGYIAYVNEYYMTRFPEMKVKMLNCGISGDSARGALKRLEWDVLEKSPNKTTIMLGMNDVGRNLYGEEKNDAKTLKSRADRIEAHKVAMKRIVDQLKEKNIEIIFITPSPYDQEVDVKTKNLKGVNDALGICAVFCREQAKVNEAGLVDFHGPMTDLNKKMQKDNPKASLIGKDRVHPHMTGHLAMAYQFLKDQGAPSEVASLSVDFAKMKVLSEKNCKATNLKIKNSSLSFDYLAKALPLPINAGYKQADKIVPLTEELNKEILLVKELPQGSYELVIDGKKVKSFQAEQFSKGVNIAILDTPQQKQAQKIHSLIMRRRSTENKLRGIKKIEIGMLNKKVDPKNEKERAKYLEEFGKKMKSSPYGGYYSRLMKQYKENKPAEKEIEKNISELTEAARKANKPMKLHIEIKAEGK